MKICIVGGGHIGTSLLCYIKQTHPEFRISLYTRKPHLFAPKIKCNDVEQGVSYWVEPDTISNDPSIAAKDAILVYIALPHFAVEKAFADIAPFVATDAMIGVLPGGGGCEFFFNKYFTRSQTLFGFQRVPFTAKLVKYGQEVNLKSWKPYSVVATLQQRRLPQALQVIESSGLRTKPATNYLEVALTPTNPILHTSRTHEIFGQHTKNHVYPDKMKFYVGWTDKASETLFNMDCELRTLLHRITESTGLETEAIRPLSEHYESPTIQAMTAKINTIPTFQSVYAPMKAVEGGYVADTNSRMFTEDFPWGLAVIRSYFEIFGLPSPKMDEVLSWYADFMGLNWFIDGKFVGKDLVTTGIIQNHGCKNIQDLENVYYKC